MADNFAGKFLYDSTANKAFIEQLEKISIVPTRAVEIMGHILLAHRIWNNRAEGYKDPSLHPWEKIEVSKFSDLNELNYGKTLWLLEHMEVEKMISYTNSTGKEFSSKMEDILFHLLLHSAYHRGQVALLMRQNDVDPPVTDYIFSKR
jgi:uncharacterized damage-inducible protein DinB